MLTHLLLRLPRAASLARPAVRWLHESPFYSINSGVIDAKVDTASAEYREALAAMNVHLDDMRKRVEVVKQGACPTVGVCNVCFRLTSVGVARSPTPCSARLHRGWQKGNRQAHRARQAGGPASN